MQGWGRTGAMGQCRCEHQYRAATRAARGLRCLAKARQELRRAERFGFFDGSLPEGRTRLIKRGPLALAVQSVTAHALQPRRGDVGEVAIEERLGAERHQHRFIAAVVLVAMRRVAKAHAGRIGADLLSAPPFK